MGNVLQLSCVAYVYLFKDSAHSARILSVSGPMVQRYREGHGSVLGSDLTHLLVLLSYCNCDLPSVSLTSH